MPLIDFDKGGKIVTAVPFQDNYRKYKRKLKTVVHPLAITSVKNWFHHELIGGIVTTSWAAGVEWRGTPYIALWEALQDHQEAGKFFGLVACECVLERCFEYDETWGYGHYQKDGIPIKGRTYFRCDTVIITNRSKQR